MEKHESSKFAKGETPEAWILACELHFAFPRLLHVCLWKTAGAVRLIGQRKNIDCMSPVQTETLPEKENFTTYQLLVRFHLKVSSFVHDPNPLAPINQGVAFFFNLFNRAPSLDGHYQPGDEATPEAAGCVGHLVVPAHCSDTCPYGYSAVSAFF